MIRSAIAALLLLCSACLPGSLLSAQSCTPNAFFFPVGNISPFHSYSMERTADDGYILIGTVNNTAQGTGRDVHIIRSDAFGNEVWSRTYAWERDDTGANIRQTDDGGFIVLGTTDSPSIAAAERSILLFKIDAAGDLLWQTTFGQGAAARYMGNDIEIDPDGNFVIAGSVEETSWLGFIREMVMLKTDPAGNLLAQRSMSLTVTDTNTNEIGPGRSKAYGVFFTANGDYIFTGLTEPSGPYWPTGGYLSVVRTTADLEVVWEQAPLYGFCGMPAGSSGLEYADGSLYIIISSEAGGCADYAGVSRLAKMGGDGQLLWQRGLGGLKADAIIEAADGNLVFSRSRDVAKVDTAGNYLWQSPIIGIHIGLRNNLERTASGGFILSGKIGQAAVLIEFDSLGNHCASRLEGTVFIDADGDCVRGDDETLVENAILKASPSNQFTNTDANGFFRFQVDTGHYELELFPPNALWAVGCPPTMTYQGSFSDYYQTASGLDFGLQVLEECPLLNLQASLPRARACMESVVNIRYCNEGTIALASARVEVQLDDGLSFVSATLPWAFSDGVYIFQLGDLAVGQCGSFNISVFIDCDAPLDSLVCVAARILPANACVLETGHDQDISCAIVRNFYDPNDKIASARDTADCWQTPLDRLEFTVRFQNTGNDTAYRALVLDTLSAQLDVATVRPGPSSHPYRLRVLGPDVVMFVFDDINLPDSITDPAGSQGYVQFSIQPGLALPAGSIIHNRAAIFFDSNAPVITEEVLIPQCVDVPLTLVQANPQQVTDCQSHNGRLGLQAMGGQGSYEFSIDGGVHWQVEPVFSGLSPGQYTILVRDEAGNEAAYFQNPVTLEAILPVILNMEHRSPSACDGTDGWIEAQVFAPGALVLYSIDGGASFRETPRFEQLAEGIYQLIAVNECMVGDTVSNIVLADPAYPQITQVLWEHPVCDASNGSIVIYANGAQSLRYSIDGGATWLASSYRTNLSAGEYEIWVSYGQGSCAVAYGSPIVLEAQHPVPVIEEVVLTLPGCGQYNGQLLVVALGGDGLEYSLNGGASFQTTPLFANLPAGQFAVAVRNALGCRAEGLTAMLAALPAPQVHELILASPDCQDTLGEIAIIATSEEALIYSIDGGNNWQASPYFEGLPAGSYEAVASNAALTCRTPAPENPLLLPSPEFPTIDSLGIIHPSGEALSDGRLEIFASGAETLLYSLDGGLSWQLSKVFSNLAAGTYEAQISRQDTSCVAARSGIELSVLTSATNERKLGVTTLSLYPNPTAEAANLLIELEQEADIQVKLLSAIGNTVAAYPLAKTKRFAETIPTAHLPAGLYYLRVEINGRIIARGLVVE